MRGDVGDRSGDNNGDIEEMRGGRGDRANEGV